MKREEYEERMKDRKYRELVVTKCEDEKDYVFISYRGNSWKTVLTEIVYKLQKKYGLRIYFDKEFASETNIWIEQFMKNMDSSHCKACLCFFDEGYVTSYATLLELMHAMNPRSKLGDSIFPISFPIDWGKLDSADWNTGLGVMDPDNPGWEEEKRSFEREFRSIRKRYPDVEDYYYDGAVLRGCDCKDIMAIIQPRNKRDYVDEEAYYKQFIVDPLMKKCPEVFEKAEINEYRVIIINNEKKSTLQIKEGDFVPKQDPGVREGFEFEGWFVSSTDEEWDFANSVHGDIEIYARWEGSREASSLTRVNENTTLQEFAKICEDATYCEKLREVRKQQQGGTQLFDYFMASLLGGCDGVIIKGGEIVRKAAYNYCKYAVAEQVDHETAGLGASQYTWTSNARKAMRREDMPPDFLNEKNKVKSGKLGEYSAIFESIDPKVTIGEVLEKYRNGEKGFNTKNNDLIFGSWNLIKVLSLPDKKGIGELL